MNKTDVYKELVRAENYADSGEAIMSVEILGDLIMQLVDEIEELKK